MHHIHPVSTRASVRGILIALLVVAGLDVHRASAQTALEGWPGLIETRLQTVYVQDTEGHKAHGKLLGLTPEALLVLVDGQEHRFDRSMIAKLQTRDSLKNGAWTGAVVGMVLSALTAGVANCPSQDRSGACGPARATLFVFGVGVYTAIGTAIDAAVRGRATLYEAPAGPPQARRSVSGPRPLFTVKASW